MLVTELLGQKILELGPREAATIQAACGQFIQESANFPIYKLLPKEYDSFQRVKVRQQKKADQITEVFNRAFGSEHANLRQRAVFATPLLPATTATHEPFFIFPLNGYKYMYSREVTNSNSSYQQVVDTLFEQFGTEETLELVTNVLKFTYVKENLVEGIISESEIIFYGIPYYYAVRVSSAPSYHKLIS